MSEALARTSDPWTSHAAAASVSVGPLEQEVLDSLRRCGPGTSENLEARLNHALVGVSPRLKPLERKGLVRRAGKKRNMSGKWATLWEAVS